MTAILENAAEITVAQNQVRVRATEATTALQRVAGELAVDARATLRYTPGKACEPVARMLDTALIRAENQGLDPGVLVVAGGTATQAEDVVRIRRKAHGVADWIASPTSDISIILRPKGIAALESSTVIDRAEVPDEPEKPRFVEPQTAAEIAVREALYDVIDPDLGVNVVDLGFIRRIEVADDGAAVITMTLTSAACPLTGVMEGQIGKVLAGTELSVEWEWLPSWRPADITEDGREQLRAIGFSAF